MGDLERLSLRVHDKISSLQRMLDLSAAGTTQWFRFLRVSDPVCRTKNPEGVLFFFSTSRIASAEN